MESYLEECLVYGHMELGELFYQNDEDVRWKFENYTLMATNLGMVQVIPYKNRNKVFNKQKLRT